MKRFLTCVTCVTLAIGLLPTASFANEEDACTSTLEAGSSRNAITPASLSDRSYDSNATGAPRAIGRTEQTVKTLVDAATAATNGYAFGEFAALPQGSLTSAATVHVGQFGAYGDSVHDDHDALQAAFNSGAGTILFAHGANYKVDGPLHIRHGDLTLLGDGATLFTDADYSGTDERFLSIHGKLPEQNQRNAIANDWQNRPDYFIENVGIYRLNIEARAYDPADAPADKKYYDPDGKKSYVQQLMVQMASNVDVFGCSLAIERPTGGRLVDGCTALDAYTGWHNLTVENCTVVDECDAEGGGGMWIRDHFSMGASNIVFKGNKLFKRCHDEILAVFGRENAQGETRGPIHDVLIAENEFTMDEGDASSSIMAFTVKWAHDVLIENNRMNVKTTGGLVWSDYASGVVVRDNDITQVRSHIVESATTNFLMFRNDIQLVENNRIKMSALDEGAVRNNAYAFATNGTVRSNTLVSDMALSSVTSSQGAIEDNDILLNAPTHVVFNANRTVTGNTVRLKAAADQYFQYHQTSFSEDVTIENNTFVNEAAGSKHTVLNLNEATMNGHVVRFAGNNISNTDLGSGARLLFLKLNDDSAQENCVVFKGNWIPDLAKYGVYCPDARHTYRIWSAWETIEEPTCTESGVKTRTDLLDPSSHETRAIDALGHDWAGSYTIDVEPTLVEAGEKSIHCTRCGAKNPDSKVAIPKLALPTAKLKTLKPVKKGFTAKWRKTAGVSGYQLQCCLKASFKSRLKTIAVKKAKTTKKTVKGLKAKKRYYVRIRTFKTVGSTKVYSAWSKPKPVKTRA